MSANSIPVVMELILDSESVRADMATLSETVRQQMAELPPVEIPLKISDEISYRIPEILADAKRDIVPLEVPLTISMDSLKVQMDEVRSMVEANPVKIPVQYIDVDALNPPSLNDMAGLLPGTDNGNAGDGGEEGGEAAFFSTRALRKAFIWGEALRAGYDTLGGLGELGVAAYKDFEGQDPSADIKGGQNFIRKLPILGDVIESAGEGIYRGVSATKNYLGGRGFDSDEAYGERLKEDSKAMEEHTKKIHEEAEARDRLNHRIDNQADLEIQNSGTKGSFDRTINTLESKRQSILDDYSDRQLHPENFDAQGNMKASAIQTMNKQLAGVDAEENHASDDLRQRMGYQNQRLAIMQDELLGNSADVRQGKFNLEFQQARDAAYGKSHDEGVAFDKNEGPLLRSKFNQDEQRHRDTMGYENRYVLASSEARVRMEQAEMARDPMAEAQARNSAIDANVQKLKEAAAVEIDLEKQKQLEIRATGAEQEARAEKAKNIAEAQRVLRERAASAEETRDRVDGDPYGSKKLEIETEFQNGTISADQRSAKLEELKQQRERELREYAERTTEYQWEYKHRPRMAEESRIEFDIQEQMDRYKKDPRMESAIAAEGAAQLRAFANPHKDSQWFDSASSYAHALQTDILNQDHGANKKAMEVAEKFDKIADKFDDMFRDAARICIMGDMH